MNINTIVDLSGIRIHVYVSCSLLSAERGCSQSRVLYQCHSEPCCWRLGSDGMEYLAPYLAHLMAHSIIAGELFFLTLLKSEAPLSSFLEKVLYKRLNERL